MSKTVIPSFSTLRKIEIFVYGKWLPVQMQDLEVNDVFRMLEFDAAHTGKMWLVLNVPYVNTEGVWGVSCEPVLGVIEE